MLEVQSLSAVLRLILNSYIRVDCIYVQSSIAQCAEMKQNSQHELGNENTVTCC
jgi:hypothetical protein